MNLEFLRSKITHVIFMIFGCSILLAYLIAYIVFAALYAGSLVMGIIDVFFAVVCVVAIAPYRDIKNGRFYLFEWKWGLPIYALLMCVFFMLMIVVTFGTLNGTLYFAVMIPLFFLVCVYVFCFGFLAVYLDHYHVGEPIAVPDADFDAMIENVQ